jgi:hypothetical protein
VPFVKGLKHTRYYVVHMENNDAVHQPA